jgi:hypothetical protein
MVVSDFAKSPGEKVSRRFFLRLQRYRSRTGDARISGRRLVADKMALGYGENLTT